MMNVIDERKVIAPAEVLEACHAAAVERYGETSTHDVIYAHATLLGDFLLFVRHSDQYLVVSVTLLPEKRLGAGKKVGMVWKAGILTSYTPPAPGANPPLHGLR